MNELLYLKPDMCGCSVCKCNVLLSFFTMNQTFFLFFIKNFSARECCYKNELKCAVERMITDIMKQLPSVAVFY
jgi:hypothetical protein